MGKCRENILDFNNYERKGQVSEATWKRVVERKKFLGLKNTNATLSDKPSHENIPTDWTLSNTIINQIIGIVALKQMSIFLESSVGEKQAGWFQNRKIMHRSNKHVKNHNETVEWVAALEVYVDFKQALDSLELAIM